VSKSIKLHPQHGVNPTIPVCFWCGEDKNEVALLGAAYLGETPHRMVLNYEPCGSCKAKMETGIALIEVTRKLGEKRPEIIPGGIPTGRWLVLDPEGAERVFGHTAQWPAMQKARKAVVEREIYDQFLAPELRSAQPDKSDGEKQ
jgi:hypothetical protein